MTYRTLLAHLDGTDDGLRVLGVATELALRFDAHLVAVYGSDWNFYATGAMDPAAGELLRYQLEANETMRDRARGQVRQAEAQVGRAIEWRSIDTDLDYQLAHHARSADLTIIAQDNPGHLMRIGQHRVSALAMNAGRGILAIPYAPTGTDCGNRILVGWNASREAARAVADAMPLLKAAAAVDVAIFRPPAGSDGRYVPELDVGTWLARHGVRVNVLTRSGESREIGELLLSLAADHGSDLLVMGAYGHTRMREFVLGGATRTVLASMTVPVLLSH